MKPSKKTIIAFDRIFWRFKTGQLSFTDFHRYTRSAFLLYDDFESFYAGCDELRRMRVRKYRWKKYVANMAGFQKYLVTLTYSDKAIKNKEVVKRKRVTQFLNFFDDWLACKDFGGKNKREHYHAIASLSYLPSLRAIPRKEKKHGVDFPDLEWQQGWFTIKPIAKGDERGKAFNYALKSAAYSFKASEDRPDVRPFHKRNVEWQMITESNLDEVLDYLETQGKV